MSDRVIIKEKEAVEAQIKKERQLIAEGKELPKRVKKAGVKVDKNKEFPDFMKYYVLLDKNKKEVAKFTNFTGTKLREGKVKDELKMVSNTYLNSRYEKDEMKPIISKLQGFEWMVYVNQKDWSMFLLFPKANRRSQVSLFIQDLSKFLTKMETEMGKTEDEIKREFKGLLKVYLENKANKKDTGTKFDELKGKVKLIDNKINKQLQGVTTNLNNAQATEILADDLKNEAAKIKAQAEELADLTGGSSLTTIIMIAVGALILIAVFGNLYVQMNQPPPPQYPPSSP